MQEVFPQGKKVNLGCQRPILDFQKFNFQRQLFEILRIFCS